MSVARAVRDKKLAVILIRSHHARRQPGAACGHGLRRHHRARRPQSRHRLRVAPARQFPRREGAEAVPGGRVLEGDASHDCARRRSAGISARSRQRTERRVRGRRPRGIPTGHCGLACHCAGHARSQHRWSGAAIEESAAAAMCFARGRRRHQAPAYLSGSRTVRRLRPFLRRRLSTSRPQRVSMRVRNPCVRTRRLLRGRYVGLPISYSSK